MVVGAHIEWNFLHGWPPFSMDDGFFSRWFGRCTAGICCSGIPFSLTLMLILLAHEMGHYLYCVKYRVVGDAAVLHSLPYSVWDHGSVHPHSFAAAVAEHSCLILESQGRLRDLRLRFRC